MVNLRVQDPERDIGGKRVVGEIDGLGDVGDLRLPAGAAVMIKRAAVDQDCAFAWFEQAEQQVHQRRLARSGSAGNPDPLAAIDGEADVTKHLSAGRIGKADLVECDRAVEQ